MGASQERIETFGDVEIDIVEKEINDFIIKFVSKVIDINIYSHNDVYEEWKEDDSVYIDRLRTHHYAYIRYIPQ